MTEKRLYYMSDIHLDYKMYVREQHNIPTDTYIEDVANYLCESVSNDDSTKYLVICGDVSANAKHVKKFLKSISSKEIFERIFFVLGNHELWKHDVGFYMNYIVNIPRVHVVDHEAIRVEDKWVLFGTGYAGKNKTFNASYECGYIYRKGISRDTEIARSNILCKEYHHLLEVEPSDIIVCTHFPPEDWLGEDLDNRCTYIYGHTHENVFDPDKHVCANGQWGYNENDYDLKYIIL